MEEDSDLVTLSTAIQEGYVPDNGMGKLLSEDDIKYLPVLPRVVFFPKVDMPVVRYKMYNALESSLHFTDGFVDGPCALVFSAFIKDLSTIPTDSLVRVPFKTQPILETIRITVKLDKSLDVERYRMARPDEVNAEEKEFTLALCDEILIDPFTMSLLNDCGIAFVPPDETRYRVDYIAVQEDISLFDTTEVMDGRRKAIKKINEMINLLTEERFGKDATLISKNIQKELPHDHEMNRSENE